MDAKRAENPHYPKLTALRDELSKHPDVKKIQSTKVRHYIVICDTCEWQGTRVSQFKRHKCEENVQIEKDELVIFDVD